MLSLNKPYPTAYAILTITDFIFWTSDDVEKNFSLTLFEFSSDIQNWHFSCTNVDFTALKKKKRLTCQFYGGPHTSS